jgi:pyruvate dehydrogenase complex dehydrogenase (E1) component
LRGFFEVDERFVTLAALTELASAQVIAEKDVEDAIEEMGIAPDKPNPRRS